MTQYISYDEMKDLLAEVVSSAPVATGGVEQLSLRHEHFLRADEDFFQVSE